MGMNGVRRIPPENIISQVLTSKKMSQAELAKRAGVKREYMNRIISRKIVPGIPLGIRIAKALDKRVEEIFFI